MQSYLQTKERCYFEIYFLCCFAIFLKINSQASPSVSQSVCLSIDLSVLDINIGIIIFEFQCTTPDYNHGLYTYIGMSKV